MNPEISAQIQKSSMVSLTVMASIECIEYIKHLKSKANTQNCQVENNRKMIFATEKFQPLVAILSNLRDHGKAISISTRSFTLPKTIKINQKEFLNFLVRVFRVFACRRVP